MCRMPCWALNFLLIWRFNRSAHWKIGSSNMEWNFNVSSIGTGLKFNVYFSLPGDIPAGKKFYLKARVSTPLDRNPVNNEMIFADIIRNSFDPNDKMDQIIRDPNSESLIGDPFYTIRFQNTLAMIPRMTSIIRDSISHLLDPKTLRIVNNSHPLRVYNGCLNLAQFHFKIFYCPIARQIILAPQGFVQFLIKPKASVKANEMIYNRAGIYFNQNPPIITNVAATSFLDIQHYIENIFIEIIPNPVKDKMLIKHNVPQSASTISAKIFSGRCSQIEQFVLDPSGSTLINPRLPSGIYYIVFWTGPYYFIL